jgi:hypothetical protein
VTGTQRRRLGSGEQLNSILGDRTQRHDRRRSTGRLVKNQATAAYSEASGSDFGCDVIHGRNRLRERFNARFRGGAIVFGGERRQTPERVPQSPANSDLLSTDIPDRRGTSDREPVSQIRNRHEIVMNAGLIGPNRVHQAYGRWLAGQHPRS